MTVLTVPPITMAVGDQSFTGTVDDVDNIITIRTDRTLAGGMNELTPDTSMTIAIAASYDGGVTFDLQGTGGPFFGGIEPDKNGVPRDHDGLGTSIEPGTGRVVRLTVTVAGPVSVVTGGTITTSA
jgi:hypothetical protein